MAGQEITYAHDGGSNLYGAFAGGTLLADDTTPVDVDILCGFKPAMIVILNLANAEEYLWQVGMDEDLDAVTAGLWQVTGDGLATYSPTGGPPYFDGSVGVVDPGVDAASGQDGFTIPAALQVAGGTLTWRAYR